MLVIMSTEEKEDGLTEVVDALENVDKKTPEASINKDTISDNNGGRIQLDEGKQSEYIYGVEN